jgi:hypothetical protein
MLYDCTVLSYFTKRKTTTKQQQQQQKKRKKKKHTKQNCQNINNKEKNREKQQAHRFDIYSVKYIFHSILG